MEALGDPRETVTSPAVTERNRDRNHIGPLPTWNAIEVANEVIEEVVGIQFFDDQLHQRARPGEPSGARRERTHCARTKLRPPPLGIELLFRPSGVFEESIDVERKIVDLAHAQTSRIATRTRVEMAGGLGRPQLRCGCADVARGCARVTTDEGQWTVVRRRPAARSRVNRPSCQGVR